MTRKEERGDRRDSVVARGVGSYVRLRSLRLEVKDFEANRFFRENIDAQLAY
jgi:hypothetical protein